MENKNIVYGEVARRLFDEALLTKGTKDEK